MQDASNPKQSTVVTFQELLAWGERVGIDIVFRFNFNTRRRKQLIVDPGAVVTLENLEEVARTS